MTPDETAADHAGATSAVTDRPMREGDEAPLRAVATRAFDVFDRLLYSTRNRDVLVAVDGHGHILGGVVLHVTSPAGDPMGRLGVVHFIFADPEAGVRGVGTALREAADARFAELGCTETSARIDAVNSASQALHRSGGYEPASVREQVRRWGWRLPRRWWQAGHGFDPGMQLWLRPGSASDAGPPALWTRLGATWLLNFLLLVVVGWRAPRGDFDWATTVMTATLTVAVLLGAREAAIRVAARLQRLELQHAPWGNGIGLAGVLAVAAGVWLPLTGSSTPQARGWRHDRVVRPLGVSHLSGALAVAGLAVVAVLIEPDIAGLSWPDVQRAAVMLALIDLVVPWSPMIGTTARQVREWSTPAWLVTAVLGVVPLAMTL